LGVVVVSMIWGLHDAVYWGCIGPNLQRPLYRASDTTAPVTSRSRRVIYI
jgi:hypothetical protein